MPELLTRGEQAFSACISEMRSRQVWGHCLRVGGAASCHRRKSDVSLGARAGSHKAIRDIQCSRGGRPVMFLSSSSR